MRPSSTRLAQVVETADLRFEQLSNGSIYAYSKATGGLVLHASCGSVYSKKDLLAFADRIRVPSKKTESIKEAGDRDARSTGP